jgi:hypothetical protein
MRNKKKVSAAAMRKVKRVPQRRNGLAGKGKSRSSSKKKLYDAAYHATPRRKKYRARLNKANAANPNRKGYDKSHTKSGKLVNEKQGKNRARNRPGRSKK